MKYFADFFFGSSFNSLSKKFKMILSTFLFLLFTTFITTVLAVEACSDLSVDLCSNAIIGGCNCRWFTLEELGVTTQQQSTDTTVSTTTIDGQTTQPTTVKK
jgi:hypothetical protein